MATRKKARVAVRPGRPVPHLVPSTARKANPNKKSASKKKVRTLHIAALDPEPLAAIERGMAEYSIGHLTRATCKMLVQYFPMKERLRRAEEKIRRMENELESLARAHAAVDNGQKKIEEILLRYYDEY